MSRSRGQVDGEAGEAEGLGHRGAAHDARGGAVHVQTDLIRGLNRLSKAFNEHRVHRKKCVNLLDMDHMDPYGV